MYYSYFNLDKATFASAPNPRYVFKATSFLAARSQLVNGFRLGKKIGIVTGKAGIGKTALCHYLISKLSTYRIASINANPLHTTIELLSAICDQLHIDYPPNCTDETLILERLSEFFRYTSNKNERIIIIIDEAHNMPDDLFEHLGGLTNPDSRPGKTKQHIVLAGHPDLIDHMKTINFLPRVAKDVVHSRLVPMNQQDTIDYIRHRLTIGGAKDAIFTSAAEIAIFHYTHGVSRLINIICDHCLRIAQQRFEPVVTPQIVKSAIKNYAPAEISLEDQTFKQKLTKLRVAPEKVVNGVSNKIEEVWRPLQEKFSKKPGHLQQQKYLQAQTTMELGDECFLALNDSSISLLLDESVDLTLPEETAVIDHQKISNLDNHNDYSAQADIADGMVIIPDNTLKSAYNQAEIITSAFLLDKTPVTNQQYARYIEETNSLPPDHWWNKKLADELWNHPVVGVSYDNAYRFAEWCGKRLPSSKEWESAARRPGDRKYPWGNTWEISHLNSVESGLNKTTAVDFYASGTSIDGCLDLVGNVWEWTDAENTQIDLEDGYAFVFGGSFRHESIAKDAIARTMLMKKNHYAYVGFRCAKDLK
ncbi:MAG: SUMF1/EgtB/PvdO family nonheme iron enzyme [Methylococcales bacterium]